MDKIEGYHLIITFKIRLISWMWYSFDSLFSFSLLNTYSVCTFAK